MPFFGALHTVLCSALSTMSWTDYLPILSTLFLSAWLFVKLYSANTRRPGTQRPFKQQESLTAGPRILSCNISHQRLFPQRHGFSYPILTVVLPIRKATSHRLLSVDSTSICSKIFLHVTAQDHLQRAHSDCSLSNKLDRFLETHGITGSMYPHVYLVTTPRLLNYSLSPASFWFMYDDCFALDLVVAEVHNTFDERRMYLFRRPAHQGRRWRQEHQKDFHVSPFSSRKGSYSIVVSDLVNDNDLDITVTLRSSKGHTKLVARWWLSDTVIDPATCSTMTYIALLFTLGWRLLITFPLIVYNAVILAQYYKLHIWYRPEPLPSAIARPASASENFIEEVFRGFLDAATSSTKSVQITLTTADGQDATNDTSSHLLEDSNMPVKLTIHTPQFYRHMVSHVKLSQFLEYTTCHPWRENCTASCSNGQALMQIVSTYEKNHKLDKGSPWRAITVLWAVFGYLRSRSHHEGSYPNPGNPQYRSDARARQNVTKERLSVTLDDFVRGTFSPSAQLRYMSAVLTLNMKSWLAQLIGGE